jgi:hypothetical protein
LLSTSYGKKTHKKIAFSPNWENPWLIKIWLTLSANNFCDVFWRRNWNAFGHVLASTSFKVLQTPTSNRTTVEQQGSGTGAQVEIGSRKGRGSVTRMIMVVVMTRIVEVPLQQGQLQGQLLGPIGVWFHHVQAAQT